MAHFLLPEQFAPGNSIALPASLSRRAIEDQIEGLIALLDTMDGDIDLEDDPLDHAELEDWRPRGINPPKPVYGIDQSLGMLNMHEIGSAYDAAIRRGEGQPGHRFENRANGRIAA